jgi:hypothetical protein
MSTLTDLTLSCSGVVNSDYVYVLIDTSNFNDDEINRILSKELFDIKTSLDETVDDTIYRAYITLKFNAPRHVNCRFSRQAIDFASKVNISYRVVRADTVMVTDQTISLYLQLRFTTVATFNGQLKLPTKRRQKSTVTDQIPMSSSELDSPESFDTRQPVTGQNEKYTTDHMSERQIHESFNDEEFIDHQRALFSMFYGNDQINQTTTNNVTPDPRSSNPPTYKDVINHRV